jgi:hypothetical protein
MITSLLAQDQSKSPARTVKNDCRISKPPFSIYVLESGWSFILGFGAVLHPLAVNVKRAKALVAPSGLYVFLFRPVWSVHADRVLLRPGQVAILRRTANLPSA